MPTPTRRRLLAALAAGSAVGLAGCSSSCPDTGAPEPETVVSPSNVATPFPTPPTGAWPATRFDAGNTGAPPDATPPEPPIGVRWSVTLPASATRNVPGGASSPTVADGTVYVTAEDAVFAHDLRDGTSTWESNEVSPATASSTYEYDEERVPAVVGPDGAVYVAGRSALVALDPDDGSVLWRHDAPGSFAFPTITDAAVYATAGSTLLALDAGDGTERWSAPLEYERIGLLPAVAGDAVVVSGADQTFAYDAATGDERWSKRVGAEYYPVVADGVVYVGTYEGLHGIGLADGEKRWTVERGTGRSFHSPVVTENTIYAVESPGEGPSATFALNRKDGKPTPRWCSYIGSGAVTAAAGGHAFVLAGYGDRTPELVAMTESLGDATWGYATGRGFPGDRVRPPAILDGAVVICNREGQLVAVGEVEA